MHAFRFKVGFQFKFVVHAQNLNPILRYQAYRSGQDKVSLVLEHSLKITPAYRNVVLANSFKRFNIQINMHLYLNSILEICTKYKTLSIQRLPLNLERYAIDLFNFVFRDNLIQIDKPLHHIKIISVQI